MEEGKRLQLLDAAVHGDVNDLPKHVNSPGDIVTGLRAAMQAGCSASISCLLQLGFHYMQKGKTSKQLISIMAEAVGRTGSSARVSGQFAEEGKVENAKIDPIANIEGAIEDIKQGKFVVVQDSASRENEGDLIIAAEHLTSDKMAFMINYTSGIICVAITAERCEELKLPQMVPKNTESHQTAFTYSIDFKHGTSTGISASDRTKTLKALCDSKVKPDDFARPGHIFPLRAKKGGVLERPGHTETGIDLTTLAGLYPAGVLSEIVNRDGSMARTPELKKFSRRFGIRMVTIDDLIQYRKTKEQF